MEIPPVDQRDFRRSAPQRSRRVQPAEPSAEDDYAVHVKLDAEDGPAVRKRLLFVFFALVKLLGEEIIETDFVDGVQDAFDMIDVLLFILENQLEQRA